jgi:lipopolysaccharide export system protein LptC
MSRRSAWQRPLAYIVVIGVISVAYFIGRIGRDDEAADAAAALGPDPGYAARDAEVIETGYDGRERYRLNASVIRQQTETGVIELEQLHMNYHPDAQARVPGEALVSAPSGEMWHLTSDRGQVRADGDDVLLSGNVEVTGPAPAGGEPLTLTTSELRVNTPTQFIETEAPVTLRWSGHELIARGMEADLKAGTLRLESEVNGRFSQR